MSTVCATANRLRLEFGFVKEKKMYNIFFFNYLSLVFLLGGLLPSSLPSYLIWLFKRKRKDEKNKKKIETNEAVGVSL